MQFLRKILFYVFAGIYVIFCPLIIMYALGYIYRPGGAESAVVKTGLIYLSSAPSGAGIYVNGTRDQQVTPATIRDLLPGDYSVRLVMDGYRQWEREVPVKAEKATVLDNVLLLPDMWEETTFSETRFSSILPVPGSGYLLVAAGDRLGDIEVYDESDGTLMPLLEEGSPYADHKVVSSFWEDESPYVIFVAKTSDDRKILIAELSGTGEKVRDITALFSGDPDLLLWPPKDEEKIFFPDNGGIDMIDVDSGAVYPQYIKDVRGAGLYEGYIYLLKSDNTIERTGYDRKDTKKIMDDPALGNLIFSEPGYYRIKVLTDEYMLFLSEKGGLISNRLPYKIVTEGVSGTAYYGPEEKVLVWTEKEIGILDFSKEETGNVDFEKGPELTWVYTEGKDIAECFWVYNGSHVLLRDAGEVFLLAVEEYGEVSVDKVRDVKKNNPFYYSEDTGKMYYLDGREGILRSIELVPRRSLITSPFPELPAEEKDGKTSGPDEDMQDDGSGKK